MPARDSSGAWFMPQSQEPGFAEGWYPGSW